MTTMAQPSDTGDATRRTWLAAERTWLAWIRTGLGFAAVALAIGKLVPSVSDESTTWPYEVIGAGYALLGVVILAYAVLRRRDLERALPLGEYVHADDRVIVGTLLGGAVLGLATAVLIVAN